LRKVIISLIPFSVDVGKLESLAKKCRINLSGSAGTLPTLVLFEDGEESERFPPIDPKTGQHGKVLDYNEKEIKRYFDLERRFLATKDAGVEKKKGQT